MPGTHTLDRFMSMQGADVLASDGDKIGSVDEIFVDEQTGEPEWIGLGTGFFGTKRVLVPVQGADVGDDSITVPYGKDQVKDTPDIDSEEISQETENALYAHYGLDYSERRSDTGLPEGGAGEPRGTVGEGEVVRSEEELRVGKRETEAGRARLRKWIETEPVEAEVETRRERARVTREQVDQPVGAGEIGEQEVEVTLRAEEPVVEKQAVARERIGLEKDLETERQTVSDDVRKERVEVEGDVQAR